MRGPRLEGGSGGQLFRSCLTGCEERRPTRRPPGRLEPGGGGGAVLSPTAAGRGVLRDTGRGRAALLRCPRSGPGPCGGGAKRRGFSSGRFLLDAAFEGPGVAVATPGRLLPPVLGALGALPGAAPDGPSLSPPSPLCPGVPGPHTPSPPHSAGCSLSLGCFCPLGPLGLTTCLHNFKVCTGFAWVCFLHFHPFVLLPREHGTGNSC